MRLPATSPITMPFRSLDPPYSKANPHMGTDFAYIPDNKIYAPFSGKAILIPNNGNDGNGIYMYNGNQFHGMLHSSQYLVSNGDQVGEGQPIGIMGDTGFAQGVHLHWCVKLNNEFIDPMSLITNKEKIDMLDDAHTINLYFALLHRYPEPETIAARRGTSTNKLIDDILNSTEYKSQQLNKDSINTAFVSLLKRSASDGDVKNWTGQDADKMLNAILGSQEYQGIQANVGNPTPLPKGIYKVN